MTQTNIDPLLEPLALPIAAATKWSGLSRSEIYRRLKTGDLRAKKSRSRTLILVDSLRSYIENLPDMV
jgi:hypothetical protein